MWLEPNRLLIFDDSKEYIDPYSLKYIYKQTFLVMWSRYVISAQNSNRNLF